MYKLSLKTRFKFIILSSLFIAFLFFPKSAQAACGTFPQCKDGTCNPGWSCRQNEAVPGTCTCYKDRPPSTSTPVPTSPPSTSTPTPRPTSAPTSSVTVPPPNTSTPVPPLNPIPSLNFNCQSGFDTIYPGITYKMFTTNSPRKVTFYVVKVQLGDTMDLMVTPRNTLGTTTSTFLSNHGADIAINGDLHWGLTDPLGLAAAAGDQYSDPSPEPSFFMSEQNIVSFFSRSGPLWDALSGSNGIVRSGAIPAKIQNCEKPQYCSDLQPRTSAGITNSNELILIVVDGRLPGHSLGVTLKELGNMHLQCNVKDAINLDGGGSSTLVFGDRGVVNRPSGGSERAVSNHLGICLGSCDQSFDLLKSCVVTEVRNNPGDDLFAGEMSADLNYTANFSCIFPLPGDGRLCELLGATCQVVPYDYDCDVYYDSATNNGYVDCYNDIGTSIEDGSACALNCTELPKNENCNTALGKQCYPIGWGGCSGVENSYFCCPSNYLWYCGPNAPHPGQCPIGLDPSQCRCSSCPSGYQCAGSCERPVTYAFPIDVECTVNPYVTIKVITKTPLAKEIWTKLVAGVSGVFRKFVPKVEPGIGSPIEYLMEIPAVSPVKYTALDGSTVVAGNPYTGRPGSEAEIYFPYIGGLHQYFLQCTQTLLRPKGYGEYCPKGTEPPPSQGVPLPGGSGTCVESNSQYCSVDYLSATFGGAASNASQICAIESGGNPTALNDGCLNGRTYDYSVGLFQINLVPIPYYSNGQLVELREGRCPGAFVTDVTRVAPPFCIIKNQAILNECVNRYLDPDYNILRAYQISRSATYWCPWKYAALKCGLQDCP